MADPTLSPSQTTPSFDAKASFGLAAKLASDKLQPPKRGEGIALDLLELGDLAGDLPLTPQELADAFAALATGYGTESPDLQQMRRDAADIAEVLAVSMGVDPMAITRPSAPRNAADRARFVAGGRAPSANAIKVWDRIARGSKGRRYTTAWREFVELTGRAAIGVVGRGQAKVQTGVEHGKAVAWLAQLGNDDRGQIKISVVIVGGASYQLPVPIVVDKQAAIHKVAHPWMLMGLQLADAGRGNPEPPPPASVEDDQPKQRPPAPTPKFAEGGSEDR